MNPADADGHRRAGRPGLSGADVELSANERGGHARLSMQGGTLAFPGVFEEPVLALQRLAGRIEWQRGADPALPAQWEVAVQDLGFANDDAQGVINGRWRTGAAEGFGPGRQYPGAIELSGRIERGQAQRVARYLPTGLPRAAREYVARAVTGGPHRQRQLRGQGRPLAVPLRRSPGPACSASTCAPRT